jgi:hypothetical protein
VTDSPLETVLTDATDALPDGGVPFALIGGVAAILYGNTRATVGASERRRTAAPLTHRRGRS